MSELVLVSEVVCGQVSDISVLIPHIFRKLCTALMWSIVSELFRLPHSGFVSIVVLDLFPELDCGISVTI